MRTGQFTTTSTITGQSVTPHVTGGLHGSAVLYSNSDTGNLRYGFVAGAVCSLSSAEFGVQSPLSIASIVPGKVTFTTAVSAKNADILTKTYTGPHQTQAEANRKRVLGYR